MLYRSRQVTYSFYTIDNGARPYRVSITTSQPPVTHRSDALVFNGYVKVQVHAHASGSGRETLVSEQRARRVWVGKGYYPIVRTGRPVNLQRRRDFALGAAVLIGLSHHRYIFVGHNVFSFRTETPVQRFFADIGNSSVPYPVVLTERRAFFMLEPRRRPKLMGSSSFSVPPKSRPVKWALSLSKLPTRLMAPSDYLTLYDLFYGHYRQARLGHLFDTTLHGRRFPLTSASATLPKNPMREHATTWPFRIIHDE